MTLSEIARETNVTTRTIRRDLEALQVAGFPLMDYKGDCVEIYWKFMDGYRYEIPVLFSLNELMGLHFCRGLLKPLKGTMFEKSLNEAMDKIQSSLTEENLALVKQAQSSFGVGIKAYAKSKDYPEILKLINQAIMNGETVRITYFTYSNGKTSRRQVDPYKLYYYEGMLYLIGYCHKSCEVRTFAVERIKMADKTGYCFEIPKDFSVEEYFKDSFGVFREELMDVRIRFDHKVAPFIKSRKWHDSQEIKEFADGSLIMDLHLAGTREVRAWLMGFAEHAEVLEPNTLRNEIQKDIKKMAFVYEKA